MKKARLVFAVAIIFGMFFAASVFAQPMPPEDGGGQGMQRQGGMKHRMTKEEMEKREAEHINKRVENLTQRFNLTEDQQTQVRAILTKTAAAGKAIMEESRAKIEALIKSDRESIKALLTEEQKTNMDPEGVSPVGEGQGPPPAEK